MMSHLTEEIKIKNIKIARIPKKTDSAGKRIMVKAVFLDLDGTIYLAGKAIDGAAETVKKLQNAGITVFFWTNNSSKSRKEIIEKLRTMGIYGSEREVYSSGYALAQYIKERFQDMKAYCISEGGINSELNEVGIKTVESQSADIVAVGLDRKVNYEKLERANDALRNGAIFIASNQDETIPTSTGQKPGAGSIVSALMTSSGKKPYVIGKPSPYMLNLALKEHGLKKTEAIVIGDKLKTDILAAKKAGVKNILVLTGVTTKEELKKSKIKPDAVIESIKELPKILSDLG